MFNFSPVKIEILGLGCSKGNNLGGEIQLPTYSLSSDRRPPPPLPSCPFPDKV